MATGNQSGESEKANVVALYAPLLVHPATHFFLGLGPTVSRDLHREITPGDSVFPTSSVQNPSTTVGASAIVGAWF